MNGYVFGIDVGTSSTKAVVVDEDGRIVRSATREHVVDRPRVGHVEMPASVWWGEFVSLAEELTFGLSEPIRAVGVSGMGPCVVLTDADGVPQRPAILYGIDTRAQQQISGLSAELGENEILRRCGSVLTTQAVGPKLRWVAENEPEVWVRSSRIFMPSSWLVWKLTGAYWMDFHSASQCTPLFDTNDLTWYQPWADQIAPGIELPPLAWPGDLAGSMVGTIGGIPAGTSVIVGTIDAWTESISVGATQPGDLMLMYGTTMFMIATVDAPIHLASMWGTIGAFEGTRNLAGGLATSGAITSWLKDLFGDPGYPSLLAEADTSGAGANGLLMLPYFAGERTPIMDPNARGTIVGLTLSHTRGDLYRAALEATSLAVRHNVETMRAAGATIRRVVAVGGGTQGQLWTQIVSDVTGLSQVVPTVTVGASYGAAFLAASLFEKPSIEGWNPSMKVVNPDSAHREYYDRLYSLYRELYPGTQDINHALAAMQHDHNKETE